MQEAADSLDYIIINIVLVFHPFEPYLSLLRLDGKLILMDIINTLQFITPVIMLGDSLSLSLSSSNLKLGKSVWVGVEVLCGH
jgi:hypothetical protein